MAELKITRANFESEVTHSDKPVLLDFWASWCGPCRMLAPIIEEIAAEYDGRVKVGKVNVDEEPDLANAFRVSGIPTVVILKGGKPEKVSVGYKPKAELTALLDQVL